jgi:hypothetical protein
LSFAVFTVRNGLDERLIGNRRLLGSNAKQAENLLFEQAEDNIKTADTAEQDLENHAPRTGVNIKGKNKPSQ